MKIYSQNRSERRCARHFDPQQLDPVAYCERCGGEIYLDERVYEIGKHSPLCCVCYVELEDEE